MIHNVVAKAMEKLSLFRSKAFVAFGLGLYGAFPLLFSLLFQSPLSLAVFLSFFTAISFNHSPKKHFIRQMLPNGFIIIFFTFLLFYPTVQF